MTEFKQNAKGVTRDILEGIGMFHVAAVLAVGLGILVLLYTVLLIASGYYHIGQTYGAIGAYGSLGFGSLFLGFYVWFRRKYSRLRKKYASLFELFEKLGVA